MLRSMVQAGRGGRELRHHLSPSVSTNLYAHIAQCHTEPVSEQSQLETSSAGREFVVFHYARDQILAPNH